MISYIILLYFYLFYQTKVKVQHTKKHTQFFLQHVLLLNSNSKHPGQQFRQQQYKFFDSYVV